LRRRFRADRYSIFMRIRQAKHATAWRLYDLLTHLASPAPAATRLIDYRAATPRRTDNSNSRNAAPVDDVRVETLRQRRLAQSLIYAGGVALVVAGSGLLLVGVRRRLW
jgi:hypothetical protein